jgi:hypothetical protein
LSEFLNDARTFCHSSHAANYHAERGDFAIAADDLMQNLNTFAPQLMKLVIQWENLRVSRLLASIGSKAKMPIRSVRERHE